MAWLGTWAKRVKLTIDSGDIDAEQTWHHLRVHISASTGHSSRDVSFVFDELESDDNRKKIALTKNDGETQLYAEIEKWDDANEQAELWVSRDGWTWASDADTDLYLYYDSTHADNTDYVGDKGLAGRDGPRENVWDGDFATVHHMGDETTSSITDSTSNNNDGTKGAAGEPTEITTGKIANAQNFDGGDHINHGNSLSPLDHMTIEAWAKISSQAVDKQIVSKGYDGTNTQWELKTTSADAKVSFRAWIGSSLGVESLSNMTAGVWYYLVGTREGGIGWEIFWNGATDNTNGDDAPIETTEDLNIGAVDINGSPGQQWTGDIDEVRISVGSSAPRSDAWIKATYESDRDHLLDWGSEEEAPAAGVPAHFMYYQRLRRA